MGFRDDRVAMRARRDVVAKERDRALTELERVKGLSGEAERARLRAQIERLADELDALHRKTVQSQRSRRNWVVGIAMTLAGLFICAGGVQQVLWSRSHNAALPTLQAQDQHVAPRPVAVPDVRSIPAETPTLDPAPTAPASLPAPEPLVETVFTTEWTARVARSSRRGIRRGSRCVIALDMRVVNGDADNAVIRNLTVRCGDTPLYNHQDSFNGVSQTSYHAQTGEEGSLRALDVGTRTGRAQLNVNTEESRARIWDDADDWEVRLRVEPRPSRFESDDHAF